MTTDTKENPFSKPAADDGTVALPGIEDVDMNPFWVPPGKYAATCTGAVQGQSNSSGNPKIVFTFSISKVLQSDGDADALKKAPGKDLKIHAALTTGAMWKVRQTLDGLGVSYKGNKVNLKACAGKKCVITVEDSDFNGITNSNIKTVELADKGK